MLPDLELVVLSWVCPFYYLFGQDNNYTVIGKLGCSWCLWHACCTYRYGVKSQETYTDFCDGAIVPFE